MQTLTSNNALIPEALEQSINYKTYFEQIKGFYEKQETSGTEQSLSRIEFTALNYQRMKRLNKTISINDEAKQFLKDLKKEQTWLVITEAWCGDSAQVIPVLNKITEQTSSIDLKLVYRDEQPELMDAFLTNGGRSIPKLIAIDKNNKVLFTWGPRPSEATKMATDFKERNGTLTPEFKQELQMWFNKDKGQNIIDDLTELLREN